MHEPGYQRKAKPFLEDDYEDFGLVDEEFDFNLYHVTTNLSGVIQSGRLKSRDKLEENQLGLGGGALNEAPHLVSITYDLSRARKIYDDIKFMVEVVAGTVPAHVILFSVTDEIYGFDESPIFEEIIREHIGDKNWKMYQEGDLSLEEVEQLFDQSVSGGKEAYNLATDIESIVSAWEGEISNSEYFQSQSITGFTAPFEAMQNIKPNNVAILQLVARKGAKADHVPGEMELRFNPEDLRVVRILKP